MAKNGEDLFLQKKFERERYARPTEEQIEIASLVEELNVSRNLNEDLGNIIDKQKRQLDQVNGAIDLFVNSKRKKGVTLDTVINVMGWKR